MFIIDQVRVFSLDMILKLTQDIPCSPYVQEFAYIAHAIISIMFCQFNWASKNHSWDHIRTSHTLLLGPASILHRLHRFCEKNSYETGLNVLFLINFIFIILEIWNSGIFFQGSLFLRSNFFFLGEEIPCTSLIYTFIK